LKTILNLVDEGQLWKFHGGIHPPSRKERTKDSAIVTLPIPARLYIPVSQHIGQPALPIVQAGDSVEQGQLLARKEGFISANVIAPASATVSEITDYAACHPSGIATQTLVLDTIEQPSIILEPLTLDDDHQVLIERISACGITGLGGASFPTAVKLAPNKPIEYLIINAAECEPYITADDALMRERANDIIDGIKVMQKLLLPQRTIIAIEDNKPQAITQITAAADDSIMIRAIPSLYPAGGEKQLIEVLTSQQVPSGKIPADIGIVVQNIATSYAAGEAVLKGKPLLSRIVTVTGDLVSQPGNYQVPLGMSIKDLLKQCGFKPAKSQKIIIGGPMMGFALHDINAPVVKATNCVIAASDRELPNPPTEQNCIRCGDCEQVCPAQLLPQQLQWFAKDQDYDKLKQHDLFDCIECGACAYVCPSSIPLVQYYRVAKAEIRSENREKEQAQRAKERFEARTARLERDKQDREERNRLAAEKRKAAMQNNGDGDAVAAALARIRAKKSPVSDDAAPTDRVAAAIARASAKKLAAQQQPQASTESEAQVEQKSRVRDAIARAKAKKLAGAQANDNSPPPVSDDDEKKDRVAAAIARAKAKKLAAQQTIATDAPSVAIEPAAEPAQSSSANDDKKARIAATIAKAKAKKLAAQQEIEDDAEPAAEPAQSSSANDDKKARIAATIAKAKAKKLAAQQAIENDAESVAIEQAKTRITNDDKKARSAATIAKENKLAAQQAPSANGEQDHSSHIAATVAKAKREALKNTITDEAASTEPRAAEELSTSNTDGDDRKSRIARTVAKAKAKALAKKNLENKDN